MKKNFNNIQHPTLNIQPPMRHRAGRHWMSGVGCWMLDVSKTVEFCLAAIFIFAGCSKSAADKPADAPEKAEAKPGVTIDAETQARTGLKLETPAATRWLPVIHAVGRVVDPLTFTAAAADCESARAATFASQSEFERTQKLAAQGNASPRVLAASQTAASKDALALKSAQARFAADWGVHLAACTNLPAFAETLQAGESSLIKLTLPVGTFPNPPPSAATIFFFGSETNSVPAVLVDDLPVDSATQAKTLLFSASQKLAANVSVTADLQVAGEPVSGVVVPASAILRHEGKGWVYVQAGTDQFMRVEIPFDRQTANGWFVSENLSGTNRIVVAGAQTVLSAELSGGGFNTGTRD
jgi:hypothetical protein